jgi:hypothetical protein
MNEDIDSGSGGVDSGAGSAPSSSPAPSAPTPAPSLRSEISRAFEGGGEGSDGSGSESSQEPLYGERSVQGSPQPQNGATQPQGPDGAVPGRPSDLVPPPGFKNPDAWKGTPVETKQWIKERESQMARGYGKQKQAADFGQAAYQSLQPIWHVLQSQGVHPLQAIKGVAQLIGVLRTGTERERYEAFLGAAQEHGIDVRRLVEGLPEADSTREHPDIAALKQQYSALAQHAHRQQQEQQMRDERAKQQWAQQYVGGFTARPEVAELLPYVWDDMAHLLESNAVKEAGKTPDQILEAAFNMACYQNPAIRKQRDMRSRSSDVNRLRGAASVGSASQPIAGGVLPSDNSIRANIERAWGAGN